MPLSTFPLLFDISGGELIVVLLFVLMFFGAKGIPDLARGLGRTMRQVRDATQEVKREIDRGAREVRRTVEEEPRPERPARDTTASGPEPPVS